MIGVVTSGGGAACVTQLGMLQAFRERNIHIDAISGVSGGSLVAAMYVQGDLDKAVEVWLSLTTRRVFRLFPKVLLPFSGSFCSARPFHRVIDQYIDPLKIASSAVRLFVSATKNEDDYKVIVADNHEIDIKTAIKASCAIPVIFPEVRFRNHWCIDGGIADNTPINPLLDMGCKTIFVLHAHPAHVKEPRSRKSTREQSICRMITALYYAQQDFDNQRAKDLGVKVINIRPALNVGTLEFIPGKSALAIQDGHRHAADVLSTLYK